MKYHCIVRYAFLLCALVGVQELRAQLFQSVSVEEVPVAGMEFSRPVSFMPDGRSLLLTSATQTGLWLYDGYRLVFADEFDLPDGSQPDSTVWGRCKRYNHGWNRWISTSTEVVYIKKGKLVSKAIPNTIEPTDTAPMLTGAIESRGKI